MDFKPILIIRIPYILKFTEEDITKATNGIQSQLKNDYHILISGTSKNDIWFEVFYDKDFKEIKYNELQDLIFKELKVNNINE